ncbi:MAG: hypothetical protein WCX31_04560 [Salinivirgaceae bacterium]
MKPPIDRNKEYGSVVVSENGRMAYLPGVKAAVILEDSSSILLPNADASRSVIIKGKKDMPKFVPWGESNDFPKVLTDKVALSPVMSANLFFNITSSFGEGVTPVVVIPKGKDKEMVPLFNAELYLTDLIETSSEASKKVYQAILDDILKCRDEVDKFFEENDVDGYIMESITDLHWFFNIFPEIILNQESGDKWKIVELKNKEAVFSRFSEMNASGQIEYHYYYGKWGDKTPNEDKEIAFATPVLDYHSPVRDMRKRMEAEAKKSEGARTYSYIIPINFPTPGRNYYQKPYWYSLIESGWYDFAIMIPELKKNIIQNQSIVNYIIELDQDYFTDIFKYEKITEEKAQKERILLEYTNLNKFLTEKEQSNKSIITYTKRGSDGKPYPKMTIKPVETSIKTGEYIEDSEEVSNIMCYAMLVHPSLVGAAPGKNSTISGSEARELFLIKQAILKPIINRVLRPFYVIKAINRWSKYLQFIIPNIELTTLDKNKTGVQSTLEG